MPSRGGGAGAGAVRVAVRQQHGATNPLAAAVAPSRAPGASAAAARGRGPAPAALPRAATQRFPIAKAWTSWRPVRYLLRKPLLPECPLPESMWLTRLRFMLHEAIEDAGSRVGFALMLISTALIVVAVVTFATQTLRSYRLNSSLGLPPTPVGVLMNNVQIVCLACFTADYVARLLTITAVPLPADLDRMKRLGFAAAKWNSFDGRTGLSWAWALICSDALRVANWVLEPLNLLDLVAIVPVFLSLQGAPSVPGGSMLILRVLRLRRVLTAFQTSKTVQGVTVMLRTLERSKSALLSMLVAMGMIIVLMGSIMYFCESGTFDPEQGTWLRRNLVNNAFEETPFKSIPHAMWYVIVTMTTVGYGDFYPTSDVGRVFGSVVIILGVITLAMPISIIGGNYQKEYEAMRKKIAEDVEAENREHEKELEAQRLEWARQNPVEAARLAAEAEEEKMAIVGKVTSAFLRTTKASRARASASSGAGAAADAGASFAASADVAVRLRRLEGKLDAVLALLARRDAGARGGGSAFSGASTALSEGDDVGAAVAEEEAEEEGEEEAEERGGEEEGGQKGDER